MRRLSNLLFILYFVLIFWYGLFIKILWGTTFYSFLKFTPELILSLFLIVSLLRYVKFISFKREWFLLLGLFNIILFTSLIGFYDNNAYMMFLRDFLLPFASLIILQLIKFDKKDIKFYLKTLAILSVLFLVSNIYFGYMQYTRDYSYTSMWYSGQVYYVKMDGFPVKVSHANGHVRAVGLVGDNCKYGFYSIFAFIFSAIYFKRKTALLYILSLLNIYFSTSKTALGCSVVVLLCMICLLYVPKYKRKIVLLNIILFSIVFIGCYILFNLEKFGSIEDRLSLWPQYFKIDETNLFVNFNMSSYFDSNNGFFSILDNSYLFGTSAYGLVTYLLIFSYLTIKCLKSKNYYLILLLICYIICSFTVNVFSGRSFFGIFVIAIGMLPDLSKAKHSKII